MSVPKLVKIEHKESYQRLLGGYPETLGMKSGRVILNPGESVGTHSTDKREEAIIVLKGKAEIRCFGKDVMVAEEGSLVYVSPETKHDVKNIGEDVLMYIYVVSPIKGDLH
jgi:quercetin dioxygenase-like cupin family protein